MCFIIDEYWYICVTSEECIKEKDAKSVEALRSFMRQSTYIKKKEMSSRFMLKFEIYINFFRCCLKYTSV
jgi:hypothetical protein